MLAPSVTRPILPSCPIAKNRKACPICGKPADALFRPFCSKRCADVDLNRWLSGVYAVPVTEDEEEDERREEPDETRALNRVPRTTGYSGQREIEPL